MRRRPRYQLPATSGRSLCRFVAIVSYDRLDRRFWMHDGGCVLVCFVFPFFAPKAHKTRFAGLRTRGRTFRVVLGTNRSERRTKNSARQR
jgi:hypothetical protein